MSGGGSTSITTGSIVGSGVTGGSGGSKNLGLLQSLSVSFNGYDFTPVGVRIVAATGIRPIATPTSSGQGLAQGPGLVSSFVEALVPPSLIDGKR